MIFVEEPSPVGQVFHEKTLVSGVTITIWHQADAVNNAPGIGINNEDWFISSVEDYGIGGLFANTVDRQKLRPELFEACGRQLRQVVAIGLVQPLGEGLELVCLSVEVAAGPDKCRQRGQAKAA